MSCTADEVDDVIRRDFEDLPSHLFQDKYRRALSPTSKASVFLFTYFLRDGEEKTVAERMRDVLTIRLWET